MIEDLRLRTQHSSTARNSSCPSSGELLPTGDGWGVFRGPVAKLSWAAAQAEAPELSALAAKLNAMETSEHERRFCILQHEGRFVANTRCQIDNRPVDQRPFAIAIVGGENKLLSIGSGESEAPHLAAVLHEYCGTEPEPRHEPEAKPVEPSLTPAARMKADALDILAEVFSRADFSPREKAQAMIDGIDTYFTAISIFETNDAEFLLDGFQDTE